MELLLALLVGFVVNRAGARWARNLPDDSPYKGPGAVIFGGGGPGPVKPK